MQKIKKKLRYFFDIFRYLPLLLIYRFSSKKALLNKERNVWINVIKHDNNDSFENFIWLLKRVPEYKNILFWRLGKIARPLRLFYKQRESMHIGIAPDKVGTGFVLQHGFSTIIEAISIGDNCQIWHNVTIGTNISGSGNKAIIGNNVKISAGAIVIGKIRIGNNVTIGAGAVVVKDVPDNCVVVGNPSFIIKMNNERVNIKL